MNNQEKYKYKEDPLIQYVNPELTEKAPKDFTASVMKHIQMESVPVKITNRVRNINLVPVISVSVTIILVLAAFLIPDSKPDFSTLPGVNLVRDIYFSLQGIDLTSIFNQKFPAITIYVFLGILILAMFDRALNSLFHREK